MIIDFESLELKAIPNFKGGENVFKANMFTDDHGIVMKATLEPGVSVGYHQHIDSGEIVYVLSGEAKLLYNDTESRLKAGMVHYCSKGNSHSIINDTNENFQMFCVVPKQ